MLKKCIICGADFSAPPTGRKTCSDACDKAQRSKSHKGKRNSWSEASKQALSQKYASGIEHDNMMQLQKIGTESARKSPVSGPFESNQNAKTWLLRSPDGKVYKVRNLAKFLRDHPDWFPNPKSAKSALYASAACIFGHASPSRKKRQFCQYKGWQVIGRDVSEENEQ